MFLRSISDEFHICCLKRAQKNESETVFLLSVFGIGNGCGALPLREIRLKDVERTFPLTHSIPIG
jgi:hypothetical protein